MNVLSPVTGHHTTAVELTIDTSKIIEQYQLLGIDVRRFFNQKKQVELRKCSATGYRFYYPYDIFGDDQFYTDLQSVLPGYYSESRWEHILSQKFISQDQKVLEVGSGSGYFLKMLRERKINSEGLELNSKAYNDALTNGLTVYNHLLGEHVIHKEGYYDVVCSFQVLEHISDVKSYMEDCIKILKPNGKIIIGVPNNNPYIFKHDKFHTLNLPPHHAGLWNRNAFENLQSHFPIKLDSIHIEPLREYKEWYKVQKKYKSKENSVLGFLMGIVPRPLYKTILSLLKNKIEGRNIIAVFSKM